MFHLLHGHYSLGQTKVAPTRWLTKRWRRMLLRRIVVIASHHLGGSYCWITTTRVVCAFDCNFVPV